MIIKSCNLDFKQPLKSGDMFIVTSKIFIKSKVRMIINQNIINKATNKEVLSATFTVTGFGNNRIYLPDIILEKFSLKTP